MEDLFISFLHKNIFSAENETMKIQAFDLIKSAYEIRQKYIENPSIELLNQLQKITDFESSHESGPNNREIEHTDIVKIILQFLYDLGYQKSYKTLQDESKIYWLGVGNIDQITTLIKEGK